MTNTTAVRLVIYLDSETYKELLRQAQAEDRSRSWIIRKLINDKSKEQPK